MYLCLGIKKGPSSILSYPLRFLPFPWDGEIVPCLPMKKKKSFGIAAVKLTGEENYGMGKFKCAKSQEKKQRRCVTNVQEFGDV